MTVRASVATTAVLETDAGEAFGVVVLAARDRYVIVSAGDVRLEAIHPDAETDRPADPSGNGDAAAADGVTASRPDAHDLLGGFVTRLDAQVAAVRLRGLDGETVETELDLVQQFGSRRRERTVDARAVDAIALAVREGCPILVAEAVVEAVGVTADELAAQGIEV